MPKPSPPTKKMTGKQKVAMETRKAVKEGSLSDNFFDALSDSPVSEL